MLNEMKHLRSAGSSEAIFRGSSALLLNLSAALCRFRLRVLVLFTAFYIKLLTFYPLPRFCQFRLCQVHFHDILHSV